MPVHWPCLLLMGCLHWLGKLWLDGQVTLLGMMEHLVFFLFFHLRFCSSCLVRMQFSHFWNMWIVEVLFCFVFLWAAGSILGANLSVTLVSCEVCSQSMPVTSLSPSKALTLWWFSQPRFVLHFKYIILVLIAVSQHQRKHTALSPKCDW